MTVRSGATSLAELILVVALFALVLTAIAGFVAAESGLAAGQRDRVRALEAGRTVAHVLGGELRALAPADVLAAARDSIRIRAVRGGGVVCAGGEDDLVIRYRGSRLPDPDKDSVVLVRSGAVDSTYAVVAVTPDPRCVDGLRIGLDRPAAPGALALVFETGTYHVDGPALRYRRGAGGRQPLTEAVIDRGWLEPVPAGFRLHLGLDADSLPRATPGDHPVLLHMLNGGITR